MVRRYTDLADSFVAWKWLEFKILVLGSLPVYIVMLVLPGSLVTRVYVASAIVFVVWIALRVLVRHLIRRRRTGATTHAADITGPDNARLALTGNQRGIVAKHVSVRRPK